jgi:hypothetical protein
MRLSRSLAGVLAALLSVALVGQAPAHAVALAVDPQATTVTGACTGGPGRVSFTVHAPAGGKYRVEVTARGLAEGFRWTVGVTQEANVTGGSKDFRRAAVDGTWTVTTRFPAPTDPEEFVYFGVTARERGDRGHKCSLLNLPTSSSVVGVADCNNRRLNIAMLARQRDDGSTVVRSLIFFTRPDSRWHLTLTASGAARSQVVEFDDRAGGRREAMVRSRIVLTGVNDSRLRLTASNRDQGRCFIGLDPPNATTDARVMPKGLSTLSGLTR